MFQALFVLPPVHDRCYILINGDGHVHACCCFPETMNVGCGGFAVIIVAIFRLKATNVFGPVAAHGADKKGRR